MSDVAVCGIEPRGEAPKALALTDGSQLELNPTSSLVDSVGWARVFPDEGRLIRPISVAEAYELAGEDFARYVTVRTRSEIEWLHLVAERVDDLAEDVDRQADRLAGELAQAA